MKVPNLFIFLLFTLMTNAETLDIELTTFKDYTQLPTTRKIKTVPYRGPQTVPYIFSQKPDLRDPLILLDHLEYLAHQIKSTSEAPENTVATLLPFLEFGCNWAILPGLILTITPTESTTQQILWDQGQIAFKKAQELKRTLRVKGKNPLN
jgi:hypothetical protein